MNIKKFSEINEGKKEDKVEKIESYIEKNKKNKSSYEMYKELRNDFSEKDLKKYFHDNY